MRVTLTRSAAVLTVVTSAALVILVAGCGSSGKPSSARGPTPANTTPTSVAVAGPPDTGVATITISKSSFGAPVTANPGQPIKLVNKDSVPYSVTSGSALRVEVKAGGTASFSAPTTPGEYPLTCHSHPDMRGTLTVRGI